MINKNPILISRELLDSYLSKSTIKLNENHTYMFTVSRFIAQKEEIIKKDFQNNSLYLCDDKYLNIIMYIYYKYYDNSIKFMNDQKIFVDGQECESSSSIYKAIWFFSKIRDSFGHGGYQFDIKNKCIKLNNKLFNINTSLPIEAFDYISFYINSIKEDDSKSLSQILEEYKGYLDSKSLKNIYDNIDKNSAINSAKEINKTLSKAMMFNKNKSYSRSGSSSENDEYDLLYRIDYGKEVEKIIYEINNSKLSSEEKKAKIKILYESIKDKSKVFEIIYDLRSSLNTDIEQALLYSHSIQLFNNINAPNYNKISFIQSKIRYGSFHALNNHKRGIIKLFNSFNNKYQINISRLKKSSDIELVKSEMAKDLIDIIGRLEDKLYDSNREITHSVRDGIFHSNLYGKDNIIYIFNTSSTIDNNCDVKFELYSSIYEYSNYLRGLENRSDDNTLFDVKSMLFCIFTSEEEKKLVISFINQLEDEYYQVMNTSLNSKDNINNIIQLINEKISRSFN